MTKNGTGTGTRGGVFGDVGTWDAWGSEIGDVWGRDMGDAGT